MNPSQPTPQLLTIDLQTIMSIHNYLLGIKEPSPDIQTAITHIETQLRIAITGILVTQGPAQ